MFSEQQPVNNSIAIRVGDLEKNFAIYEHPRDRLKQFVLPRLRRIFGKTPKQYFRAFSALKNVSFEIAKGETVGIIGRNGAGKSTLLQILCGTLTPSGGTVEINGRVAALLELGAGFNTEFTGRENIYMNAGVLGLSESEINARFVDIVAFADIGEFLEQPVKTYSSGMYVRLAFAIAVHVEPEILVIDEALSVGDIAFQNKCIDKIKSLRLEGTTLLFVSHDMSTLQMICDRVIWIDKGEVRISGSPITVCQEYYVAMIPVAYEKPQKDVALLPQQTTGMAEFIHFSIEGRQPQAIETFWTGERISFNFSVRALKELDEAVFALSIYRSDGDWLIGQTSLESDVFWPSTPVGEVLEGTITLDPICLAPGEYRAACGTFSKDLASCYAMTEVILLFSIRSRNPNWGKIIHPCKWVPFQRISA